MATLDSVLNAALALPVDDRSRLIQRLIETLEGDDDASHGAEDAWAEVVERRVADLDAGRAHVIDGKAAIAKARQELAARRQSD